jgi:DNA helicase-2/ATP-dependent DNA helicase PcrA
MGLVQKWEKSALCKVEGQSISYRCNKYICDFANSFWPDWAEMKSNNNTVTGHDGVFVVSEENAHAYIDRYKPAVLRYDRNADSLGYTATNFGEAKGLEFDRVLIVPHGPMKKYLRSGDLNAVEKSLAKFYVAVTRARHSVAFLYDGEVNVNCKVWQP